MMLVRLCVYTISLLQLGSLALPTNDLTRMYNKYEQLKFAVAKLKNLYSPCAGQLKLEFRGYFKKMVHDYDDCELEGEEKQRPCEVEVADNFESHFVEQIKNVEKCLNDSQQDKDSHINYLSKIYNSYEELKIAIVKLKDVQTPCAVRLKEEFKLYFKKLVHDYDDCELAESEGPQMACEIELTTNLQNHFKQQVENVNRCFQDYERNKKNTTAAAGR